MSTDVLLSDREKLAEEDRLLWTWIEVVESAQERPDDWDARSIAALHCGDADPSQDRWEAMENEQGSYVPGTLVAR